MTGGATNSGPLLVKGKHTGEIIALYPPHLLFA